MKEISVVPEGDRLDDLDQAVAVFAETRRWLFGIAYRMLGSALDAEDLVQEVWVRWQTCDRSVVVNPAAYLTTAITRLAINVSQSARKRHETYVGPWLPEPVDTSADPQLGAERTAGLEFAVLLLLEKLTPTERAAYVLREAFDYPYSLIAEIVQTSQASARQLVSRARKHLQAERRTSASTSEQRRLLTAFVAAAQAGDMAALEQLFAEDVVSYADSGGLARAARTPVHGAHKLATVIESWGSTFWTGADISWTEVNGQTAVVLRRDGAVFGVVSIAAWDEKIGQVFWMVNPDKLTAVG